jgi:hypothetical protein
MAYDLPEFLHGLLSPEVYLRWLQRRAVAHVKRDRKRGNLTATVSSYKRAIHDAVTASNGFDFYTGEKLDWPLISHWDYAESKSRGRLYKKEFASLPTVDHIGDSISPPEFVICSWCTNDAKHDLTLEEFILLCRSVLRHYDAIQSQQATPAVKRNISSPSP